MTLATTRRELSNVIAGRTAEGSQSNLPLLSFSKSENVFGLAAIAADLMMRVLTSHGRLSADERTQLLWKLAAYVTKTGVRLQVPSLPTRAVHAAQFLVDRRRLITSRMGMGKIIELSQQEVRSRETRMAASSKRVESQIRSEPDKVIPSMFSGEDAPPRPILWLSLDRNYRLEELVHPAHLFEEGARMHHCLTWKTAEYWRTIRSGRRRIYSLRRNSEYCATFTHVDQRLTELTLRMSRDEAMIDALAEAYRHIDRIYGPLCFDLRDGKYAWLRAKLSEHQKRFH